MHAIQILVHTKHSHVIVNQKNRKRQMSFQVGDNYFANVSNKSTTSVGAAIDEYCFHRQPHPLNPEKPVNHHSLSAAPASTAGINSSLARRAVSPSSSSSRYTGGCKNRVRHQRHSSPSNHYKESHRQHLLSDHPGHPRSDASHITHKAR
jgi:hypothetical protein